MEQYYAHIAEDGRKQTVREHLIGTSNLSGEFGSDFGAAPIAKVAGAYHDLGKYSPGFQERLNGGERVDHSTAGAELIQQLYSSIGAFIAAFCIADHHTGLQNGGTPDCPEPGTFRARLEKVLDGNLDYSAYKNDNLPSLEGLDKLPFEFKNMFQLLFFIRMVYSCIIDADYLDTEAFMLNKKRSYEYDSIETMYKKLEAYIKDFWPPKSLINEKRCDILEACLEAAHWDPGLFSLTVPTGGGKTIAAIAFALLHAMLYHKKRIIYVIPQTSIIEQNAAVIEKIVGLLNVIQHHMNADYTDDKKKLATENWDAPIIFTTNVQFFESLYGNKTSRCRKLHNIANSVVIFDEAQMLPLEYLKPCVSCIDELVRHYNVSAVLCTATQPNLDQYFGEDIKRREICENAEELYDFFTRVTYKYLHKCTLETVASMVNTQKQALLVFNTKKRAAEMFDLIDCPNKFYLTTNMYPEHRRRVLQAIRNLLDRGEEVKVVSTSVIEAGVDVDFEYVYTELTGTDSIIQRAGRCNRENKRNPEESIVYIFELEDWNEKYDVRYNARQIATTKSILDDLTENQTIADLQAIDTYFTRLHFFEGANLDKEKILAMINKSEMLFETIAKTVKLIKDDTRPIFIVRDPVSLNILGLLNQGIRTRQIFREMGKYVVNVYEEKYQQMLEDGVIDVLDENINVLNDADMYSDSLGLL